MTNPTVSIVIPIYNGANYMREAIDSALGQTYGNCEVIVVNDGSTDATEETALSYGDKIRYFAKENGGLSTALNLAIENMRGEYFSWLSHDDVYYSDKIENQVAALKLCGDMRRICWGDLVAINEKSEITGRYWFSKKAGESLLTDSIFPVIMSYIGGCSLLIHRSHFERVGVFNTKLRYTQDNDLWFRMFRGQRTVFVDSPLYKMRIHGASDTASQQEKIRPEAASLRLGWVRQVTDEEIERMYGDKIKFYSVMYERILRSCGREAAEAMFDIVRERETRTDLRGE